MPSETPFPPPDADAVRALARLARLRLAPGEEEAMARDLARILAFVARLDAPGPRGDDPDPAGAVGRDGLRDDRPSDPPGRDAALHNAPDTDGTCFLVPRVPTGEEP